MQNLSKKIWAPTISLKNAIDLSIEWCIRAREKNILRRKGTKVYYSYVLEDTPPLNFFTNVSSIFKYSQKDIPYVDTARDTILRLLSVCFKAHFFLFSDKNVSHEPYFFIFPNLDSPLSTKFGILYKIEGSNKCIVACEDDLSSMFNSNNIKATFNVVVSDDSFKWYSMKNWAKYKNDQIHSEIIDKPWVMKKLHNSALEAKTLEDLSNYATVLDVPYEIKDFIKPLGIEWSKTLKTWFLPKGFDIESVQEYIQFLKRERSDKTQG